MGGLFGRNKTTVTPTVPKEDKYEADVREQVTNLVQKPLQYYDEALASDWNTRQGLSSFVQTPDFATDALKSLVAGELPESYMKNMTDAVNYGLNDTMGAAINDLANRGVINSSVSGQAFKRMSDAAAGALAQGYNQSMGVAGNLAQMPINNYYQGISALNAFMNPQSLAQPLEDLYSLWRTTRYGSKDNVTTTQEPGILDAALGIGKIFMK